MMETMVERVARALCRESEIYPEDGWEHLESWARAAIEAMRTPTEAMLDSRHSGTFAQGDEGGGAWVDEDGARGLWEAMIDAALT